MNTKKRILLAVSGGVISATAVLALAHRQMPLVVRSTDPTQVPLITTPSVGPGQFVVMSGADARKGHEHPSSVLLTCEPVKDWTVRECRLTEGRSLDEVINVMNESYRRQQTACEDRYQELLNELRRVYPQRDKEKKG